jgi:hypothetical protein
MRAAGFSFTQLTMTIPTIEGAADPFGPHCEQKTNSEREGND